MISFVVPVYRSAEILPGLHRRIYAVFGKGEQDFEIVFVQRRRHGAFATAAGRVARRRNVFVIQ